MSLDNVLAVAGVAKTQAGPWVLYLGLVLSVALMGVASSLVAGLLARHFWLSWLGLAIIAAVAVRMIWAGGGEVLGHLWWGQRRRFQVSPTSSGPNSSWVSVSTIANPTEA
jgi:predicted tellurium resistance membrane protein TerC